MVEAVQEILHGILVRRFRRGRGDALRLGLAARLHGHEVVVVVVADRALGAGDDEAAARLRLERPRIGEGAPARLELRQPVRVARDDDAVLVHLEAGRRIDGGGDFEGAASALVPGAECGAVAEVIEERAAAVSLLVEPGVGLFLRDLRGCFLVLVRAVKERAAIAAEMPDVRDFTDDTGLDEIVGLAVRAHPLQRPVDHERPLARHGGDHGIGFLERRGEGFLNHDVRTVGSDFLHPLAVLRGGGAEDDDIGLRGFEAGAVVGEGAFAGEAEFAHGFLHARGLLVGDADDLGVRMFVGVAEQVAHVEVVEVDAGDFPNLSFHA